MANARYWFFITESICDLFDDLSNTFFCCWLLVVLFLQPPTSQGIAAAGLLLVGSRILSIGKNWAKKKPCHGWQGFGLVGLIRGNIGQIPDDVFVQIPKP